MSYLQVDGKWTDEPLTLLKDLKGVVHLNLRGQPVTDAQLVHLKPLTELTHLHLERTKITDKGLENLKGLANLEYLNLYGTAVGDAGLTNLEGMKKLKKLYVWDTKVTAAGAAKLKKAIPVVEVNLGIEDKPEPTKVVKNTEPKKEEKKPEPKKEATKTTDEMATLLKARVAVAEKIYRGELEGLTRTRRVGNVLIQDTEKPEEVYTWSVRWLKAQRDSSAKHEDHLAALEAHLKRMTELKKAVESLSKELMPAIRVEEAEWYRLEAHLWLAKAKQANAKQAKAK